MDLGCRAGCDADEAALMHPVGNGHERIPDMPTVLLAGASVCSLHGAKNCADLAGERLRQNRPVFEQTEWIVDLSKSSKLCLCHLER